MAREGQGRRTRQYNPGAQSLGAYAAAVSSHRRGSHDAAGKTIHETPEYKRREYAGQIWALRREHGTDKTAHFDWDEGSTMKRNPYTVIEIDAGGKKTVLSDGLNKKDATAKVKALRKEYGRHGLKYMVGFSATKNPMPLALTPILDAVTSGVGFAAGAGIYQGLANRKKKNSRRNPGASYEEAATLAQEFHGRPPKEVIEAQESHMEEGHYAVLGEAVDLWLECVDGDPNSWPKPTITFDDGDEAVLLAADPRSDRKRSQFYFVGGDQSLDERYLEDCGIPVDTNLVPLGMVYGICYIDAKSFDGGEPSQYAHRFGEETGEVPALYYDRKKQKMYLIGGAYGIAPVRDDLNASPGIVN